MYTYVSLLCINVHVDLRAKTSGAFTPTHDVCVCPCPGRYPHVHAYVCVRVGSTVSLPRCTYGYVCGDLRWEYTEVPRGCRHRSSHTVTHAHLHVLVRTRGWTNTYEVPAVGTDPVHEHPRLRRNEGCGDGDWTLTWRHTRVVRIAGVCLAPATGTCARTYSRGCRWVSSSSCSSRRTSRYWRSIDCNLNRRR